MSEGDHVGVRGASRVAVCGQAVIWVIQLSRELLCLLLLPGPLAPEGAPELVEGKQLRAERERARERARESERERERERAR